MTIFWQSKGGYACLPLHFLTMLLPQVACMFNHQQNRQQTENSDCYCLFFNGMHLLTSSDHVWVFHVGVLRGLGVNVIAVLSSLSTQTMDFCMLFSRSWCITDVFVLVKPMMFSVYINNNSGHFYNTISHQQA